MKDVSGDAQWPHYSPTGAGLNLPQLDFTNLAVSQPSPRMLRVKMTLANLNGLLPPPGKTSAVWLTRFQALSVGDFGEEAYRIFYVGAESTGGPAPQYFAGSTTCTDTTPQNCKIMQYPRTMAATGKDLRQHDLRGRAGQRRLRDRAAGRQQALQRDRLQFGRNNDDTTSTRTSTRRTRSTTLSEARRGAAPAER